MWAQLVSVALGLWLMASPAVLGYGDPARAADQIVGPIAASFAAIAISEVTRAVRRVNYLTGAWLLLAPWVLGYGLDGAGLGATVNSLTVGLLLVGLATVHGTVTQRFGGGWAAVWSPARPRHDREHAG